MIWRARQLRALGAVAIVAAALGASGVARAQTTSGWHANEDDALLLQPQVGAYKLNNDVRGYMTDRGVCLDLADVIQSLDLPIRLDKKSRRATGWLFAEDQRFVLDRVANTVQNVNIDNAPVADDIYDTPEGWCVNAGALSRWFGITFRPDTYNAVVRLESDRKLPFIEAIERKSRAARLQGQKQSFDLSQYPHADMEYKVWRTPSVDVVAQAGYRSDTQPGDRTSAQVELYAAGEIANVSYNVRLASDRDLQPESLRFTAYRYDPDGKMLGSLKATQLAAGDVQTQSGQLTGQTAVGRGAFISNQPLGRRSRFSETSLRGILPAGWDAELYRNGQLIAFQDDSGDGRYEFLDIDLYYGRNDLEVVLYGPQGQVRREKTSFPVGTNNLEPGQTYYWAGALQDDHDLIEISAREFLRPRKWRWGAGVEYGLDKKTSLALGLQGFWLDGQRRNFAETTLWRTLGPMQLELATAHEFGAGVVTQANLLGRMGKVNLSGHALWAHGDFHSEFVAAGLERELGLNFDTSLKLGRLQLPIQAGARRAWFADGSRLTNLLMQASITTRAIAFSAQLDHEQRESPGPAGDYDRTQLRLLANTRLAGVRLRGNADFQLSGFEKGFESARLLAEQRITDRSDLAAEVEYYARYDKTRFSLGYSRRFDRFALRANASADTQGEVGANVALSFSFGPDPVGGGIRFSETKLARTGLAAVTVFRDDNGDGRRSPDEPLLPDVGVEAGLRRTDALTGANGTAVVDGLVPYQAILVGIDESTLEDPFLAASSKGVVVTPRPGVAAKIELGISPSGEVEGVLLGLNGVELGGVGLELIDRGGKVIAATVSEFDGFFLFQRVPYGEYRLRIAEDSARALAVKRGLGAPLVVARDKDVARLGAVRLEAAQTTLAASSEAATLPIDALGP